MSSSLKYTLPKSWDEVSPGDFVDLVSILESGVEKEKGLMQMLWIMSGLSDVAFSSIDYQEHVERFDELEWYETLAWHRSFLPQMEFKRTPYKGPADNLANFNLDQFIMAEHFLKQYTEHKKPEDLNRLVSVLYQTGPFLLEDVEKRYPVFEGLDQHLQNAAYYNYLGLREHKRTSGRYPGVFGKGGDTVQSTLNAWDVLKDDLAGSKFGPVATVGLSELDLVLVHFQNLAEKADKVKLNK